jgi:Protein of unknown function (DUF2844)
MKIKLYGWLPAAMLLLVAHPALAGLGGDYNSIAADRTKMQAGIRLLPAQQFTVHELQAPSGTTVREYVSFGGKVFAVTWRGPQMPDLQQLFGNYFGTYKGAAETMPGRHGPLIVNQPGLVVESGGHMRAFSGRAYVPQLMPQGVTADEIK